MRKLERELDGWRCCIAGCAAPAETVYFGFMLCGTCLTGAYEWGDYDDLKGLDDCLHAAVESEDSMVTFVARYRQGLSA